MPFTVLIFLLIILFFVTLAMLIDFSETYRPSKAYAGVVCFSIILFIAGVVWPSISTTDEKIILGYYPIQSGTFKDCNKQFIIVNETFVNVTEEMEIFPEGSYVRVYQKKSYKNGINWHKGNKILIDNIVIPTSDNYEQIKKNARN